MLKLIAYWRMVRREVSAIEASGYNVSPAALQRIKRNSRVSLDAG